MPDACLRINSPSVIFERFGDEVVAIHLDTGVYHSLVGVASDAFVLLSEEATAAELAGALSAKYAASTEEILMALAPFLEQLKQENLVVPVEERKARSPLRIEGAETGLPFVPPALQAFNDLEGLLLLDPIHEVGEEGWPQASEPRTP